MWCASDRKTPSFYSHDLSQCSNGHRSLFHRQHAVAQRYYRRTKCEEIETKITLQQLCSSYVLDKRSKLIKLISKIIFISKRHLKVLTSQTRARARLKYQWHACLFKVDHRFKL